MVPHFQEATTHVSIMTLEDDIDVSRGDMIVKIQNEPVVTQDVSVLVTTMSERALESRTKVF